MSNSPGFRIDSLSPSSVRLIGAFAAVYIVWGSTYLAIHYAVETMPPFLMAGVRFMVGGAIMYVFARATGDRTLGWSGWRAAIILGLFLLVGGNAGVAWAEQWVPSGVAAVLIATTPLWIALLEWIRPGGSRPPHLASAGILLGFLGTAFLVQSGSTQDQSAVDPAGAIVLIGAALSWSIGTLYGRQAKVATSTTMTTAMQMLMGGTMLLLISAVAGEWSRFRLAEVSAASAYGLLYLVVFGGFIGFNAYNYLVKNTTSARLATYAYVNPAVAVFLGWTIAGEPITARMLLAIAIIIVSVVVITRA